LIRKEKKGLGFPASGREQTSDGSCMGGSKMAGVSFGDIEDAFLFVSSAPYGTNSAYLNLETGEIFYRSEMMGITELEGEKMDRDQMIEIPHKNDLELGQSIVFEFVEANLPDAYHRCVTFSDERGRIVALKSFLHQTICLKPGTGLSMNESRRLSDPGARRIRSPYRISCREIEGLFSRVKKMLRLAY